MKKRESSPRAHALHLVREQRPDGWRGALAMIVAGCALAQMSPGVAQTQPPPTQAADAAVRPAQLEMLEVIGASPLIGSGVDRDTAPVSTFVLTGKRLARDGAPNLVGAMNDQFGGVTLDSAAGNPFQPTLLYHGFQASPLQGTAQGLAVYVGGMRFNQPFGETVDWELIPDIAIDRVDVVGSNPVFGLNALGGAVNVMMKDGFGYQGAEADLSSGSFGQRQAEFQLGKYDGASAIYVAGKALQQTGWRDLQSSEIQNLYADVGWRDQHSELHANATFAHSILNGPGTSPVELIDASRRAQFTAPNRIANQYAAASVTGTWDLAPDLSLQSLAYYRYFHQRVVNGNVANDGLCDDGSGLLCSDSGLTTTGGGVPVPDFLAGGPYAELDTQSTNTNAYGAAMQITSTRDLLGLRNHLVAGASFDGARTHFGARSLIGGLSSPAREFIGPGIVLDEPNVNSPVDLAVSNASYGAYIADTLTLTRALTLTMSARYNAATIDLHDRNGGDLSGDHRYAHLNPAAGLAWRATPWLTAYAGYAVANRAPTPAELSCAGPENSCSLANFFVGDPELEQVVAHTVEAGLRGKFAPAPDAKLTYAIAFYRTDLDNDIAFVNSATQGRAFFANIGGTRRQGVDLNLELNTTRWQVFLAYSHIDATYRSGFVEASGDNPAADAGGNIAVRPGNRLPGIPADQIKFGAHYNLTSQWSIGATGIAAGRAYLFGDEGNVTPQLPAYVTLDLKTTYQLAPNVLLFASITNVTDRRYYTFGTFSPTSSVFLAEAPNATNPRSYSVAAPRGAFGGVRLAF